MVRHRLKQTNRRKQAQCKRHSQRPACRSSQNGRNASVSNKSEAFSQVIYSVLSNTRIIKQSTQRSGMFENNGLADGGKVVSGWVGAPVSKKFSHDFRVSARRGPEQSEAAPSRGILAARGE